MAYAFVSALACYRVHRGVGCAAIAWAALIGMSTVFTKQHYVVDVPAGALLAVAAYVLVLRRSPRAMISEENRREAPGRALLAAGLYGLMVAGAWFAWRLNIG